VCKKNTSTFIHIGPNYTIAYKTAEAPSLVHTEIAMAKGTAPRRLRIPLDFDEAVKALLGTPPPPKDTPGTRTAKKTKKRKAKKR
jgi:hypothetical protein